MSGFPPVHCRVVASVMHEGDAYVLLDCGSPGQPYLYGVNCVRREGGWSEMSSGNGPGWSLTVPDRGLGTPTLWGDAPADADLVRVNFNGLTSEVPVRNGAYLAVWWRVPSPRHGWPPRRGVPDQGCLIRRLPACQRTRVKSEGDVPISCRASFTTAWLTPDGRGYEIACSVVALVSML